MVLLHRKFREDVYKAIDTVTWMPDWGHDRMKGMVRDRNDWCISRQRTWGVPIPAFYCKKCGTYHITDATIKAVSDLFRKEGSDAWYKYEAEQIIPAGEVCEKCGASEWTKDTDIMDVWFDSGSTHAAVLEERPELRFPADMYMEGGDQFRGWFQSSLLTCVATQGVAPTRRFCATAGSWMRRASRCTSPPATAWSPVRSSATTVLTSSVCGSLPAITPSTSAPVRKFSASCPRHTARCATRPASCWAISATLIPRRIWSMMTSCSRLALALEACNKLTATMRDAYEHYDFSRAYHALYNFCVIDMSNFYMDVIKDRLYCADDHARRCAQTALYRILVDFTKLLAPILCFTSQEIWSYIPKLDGMKDYVVFEQMPEAKAAADEAF